MNPTERTMLASRAAAAVAITPTSIAKELDDARDKITRGLARLAELSEDDLAIATVPRDEVWREDMVRLYRCTPMVDKPHAVPIMITYALVGRFQMIDLEVDRSLVRKLLAQGFDVYFIDWGTPGRAQRWLTIDDYVSGYLDRCVDVIRARSGDDKINMLGICQGGVFTACYAALFPQKVRNVAFTVTPIDFHGDKSDPQAGSGYMNQWARALTPRTSTTWSTPTAPRPGSMVGLAFLMMNPVSNLTKYTIDLIDVLDNDAKLRQLPAHGALDRRPARSSGRSRAPVVQGPLPGKQAGEERAGAGRAHGRACARSRCPCSTSTRPATPSFPCRARRACASTSAPTTTPRSRCPAGHIGTFVGGKAQKILAPTLADWFKARSG